MTDAIEIYLAISMFALLAALVFFLVVEALTVWKNGKVNRMWTINEMCRKGNNDDD